MKCEHKQERILVQQKKNRNYIMKKEINPLEVKIGYNVFLLKGGKIKKLDSHYTGPCEILEMLGKGNVKISYKGKPTVVHIYRPKRSHVQVQK